MRRFSFLLIACVLLCAMCFAQDQQAQDQQSDTPAPSLGEVARQNKLKKQQREAEQKAKEAAKVEAQASDATPAAPPASAAHLVTKDETPGLASVTSVSTHPATSQAADSNPGGNKDQANGENLKSQILAQKNAIAALEQDIKTIGASIHFAGANCIANCTQWNERQQQKQQEVNSMKAQLEEAKKQLKEMQEAGGK